MSGMIDFLVSRINEESGDAGVYMEWASKCNDPKTKEVLNTIANQELHHQKMLIDILAGMAKKGETPSV